VSGSNAPPNLTVFANGNGVVLDNQLNGFVQSGCLLADLRDFVGLTGMTCWMIGTTSAGDGGQGMFCWSGSATTNDDGGVTTIAPYNTLQGRWLRQSGSPGSGSGILALPNIAALRNLTTGASPVWVEGYTTPNDGGQGMFVTGAAATDNGGTIIVSADGTYYRETGGGPYSVQWFGATINGSTDDTAAIQNAINVVGASGGGVVTIPAGSAVISGISISNSNVTLQGSGRFATVLRTTSATGNTIQIGDGANNPGNVSIRSLGLQPSVTRTGGGGIVVVNGHFITISDIVTSNDWVSIQLEGGAGQFEYRVENFEINATGNAGILLGASASPSDVWIGNGVISGAQIGIYLASCNGVYMSSVDIIDPALGGVYISPPSGKTVTAVFCQQILADTATAGPGWLFGGVGQISNIICVGCWGSTCAQAGFLFANGNINGVTLDACSAQNNQQEGISIGAGTGIVVSNSQIFCNSQAGAAAFPGIGVGTGVNGFYILNNQSGLGGSIAFVAGNNQSYGLLIETGCGIYIVEGNSFLDNVTAGMLDQSNSSIVGTNLGYVTETTGQALITTGNTSVTVAHGLALTPFIANIFVTPATPWEGMTNFWVGIPNSTSFTINSNNAVGSNVEFNWYAFVKTQ
jgi:hypothetical protein